MTRQEEASLKDARDAYAGHQRVITSMQEEFDYAAKMSALVTALVPSRYHKLSYEDMVKRQDFMSLYLVEIDAISSLPGYFDMGGGDVSYALFKDKKTEILAPQGIGGFIPRDP